MNFRTEIKIKPFAEAQKIDHSRRGFSIGSCFAQLVTERLQRAKISVTNYSGGVLYNPVSIADALRQSPPDADWVLVTLGTAWVYERDGRVVANCGKQPASLFTRKRLTINEIVEHFDALFAPRGPLFGRQVILSLSPIRHLRDSFEENSLSKAILRVAIDEIVSQHADCQYFPAYEIVNDDLRDYRFYGPDMAHPSAQAVDYIWEKFSEAALSRETLAMLPEIEAFVQAAEHRQIDANSLEHNKFRASMRARLTDFSARHPKVDMTREIEYFC